MEEMIDVLDENGIKTGEILSRSEIHKRGLWHRLIVVAIINEKNEILMQQRSKTKTKNPNMWDISAAGHIGSGQTALSAAAREMNEEISINLGYTVTINDFRYVFSYRKEEKVAEDYYDRQFFDFFILRKENLRIEDIKIQESEVQAIKWCSLSELKELIEKKEVIERDAVYKEIENYIFSM